MTKTYKCPTCDGYIPSNEHIGAYPGAISRRDNKTEICSACGVKEAFDDLLRGEIESMERESKETYEND